MVALKSILLGFALGTEVLAVTSSSMVCNSKLGTSSVRSNKIPRATTILDYKVAITKKFIRKVDVLIIPRPRTTTVTETSKTTTTTVAPANVKTATEIVTDEQTSTQTVDTTTTTTSTSCSTTTVTTTNTVAAPAGFTGLLQDPAYVPKVKARAARRAAAPVIPGLRAGQKHYVQRIDCTKRVPVTTIKSISITVRGPHRTLQPKTKTMTTTTTETVTETSYPPDVTETTTETVSPTTTSQTTVTHEATSVETVTVESDVPGDTTFYAACGSSNILRTANGGNPVVHMYITVNSNFNVISGVSGAYDCCVHCMQDPTCFLALTAVDDSSCTNVVADSVAASCPNGQLRWADYSSSTRQQANYVWSNGPCGSMGNKGNQ